MRAMKSTNSPCYGEVPGDWGEIRLKYVAQFGPSKEGIKELHDRNETVTFLPMERISEKGEVDKEEQALISTVWGGFTFCQDGDVIVAKITPCFENGKGALLEKLLNGVAFASTEFYVLRPHRRLDGKYLYYLTYMYPFRDYGKAQMQGAAGQQRVPQRIIKDLFIGLPQYDEQQTIADFLDHKTALIDQYIANKKKQIELLEKLRTSIISEAVTKGLDPDVEMKDSGVKWFGKVPAHWKRKRLKFAVMFQRGHDLPDAKRCEGEIPIISSGGNTGFHNDYRAVGPIIVTGRYGTIGVFHYIEGKVWPLNTALYSIKHWGNDVRYLWYLVQSISELFLLNSSKSAVPGVDRNDIHPTLVVAPPEIEEQQAIARFLDTKMQQIDGIKDQLSQQIEKIQSYRASLISEAVTGKIDVRGFNPEPMAV